MKPKIEQKQNTFEATFSLQEKLREIAKKAEENDELFSLDEAKNYLEKHFEKKIFPTKLKN